MPKRIAPLSEMQIKKAKPAEKDYKLFDGGGLFLLVTPTGGKLWRLKYRFGGTEKQLSLGAYPEISLQDARQRREDARRMVANGDDPSQTKKAAKVSLAVSPESSFEVVARVWHGANVSHWAESHAKTTMERLEKNIFPWLGKMPIDQITLEDIKPVLQRIEQRAPESARRMFVALNMIFRYSVVTSRIPRNPIEGLRPRDLLTVDPISRHLPAIIDPKELSPFLNHIERYKGTFVTKCAMQLAPLLFQRPGDLRHMEWVDLDLETGEWNIPVSKMKLTRVAKIRREGEAHCVPLPRQAVEILTALHALTGRSPYVFPGARSNLKPMSEAAITTAIHRMGYQGEMTWHGFRATARTILDEVLEFPSDIIEHQLAHAVRDPLGRAYNRTTKLPQRRKMMQAWADYLDELKAG